MKENEWVKGFACALAVMLKSEGLTSSVTDELFGSGIGSLDKAREAGVHPIDMEELERYYGNETG